MDAGNEGQTETWESQPPATAKRLSSELWDQTLPGPAGLYHFQMRGPGPHCLHLENGNDNSWIICRLRGPAVSSKWQQQQSSGFLSWAVRLLPPW